jgi:hypothetical protein
MRDRLFHDETKLEAAQRELPVGQVSYIAEESAPLRGLAQVNQEMVGEVGRERVSTRPRGHPVRCGRR